MKKTTTTLLTSVGALSLASIAHGAIVAGDIIGIDFQPTPARAPGLATGTNFNVFESEFTTGVSTTIALGGPLVNSTGAAVTGVGFGVTNNTGQSTTRAVFGTAGAIGSAVSGSLLAEEAVWDDAIISNNQGGAPLTAASHFLFTFTGLDDSLTYNLEGGFDNLAAGGGNNNFDAIWAADGQTFTTSPFGGSGYGALTGLETDGSGNLVIQVNRTTTHITVSGLTLEAVPEPSTSLLAGLAGLGLMLRRRR